MLVLIVFYEQVLIFSQWTKILDIMHYYLDRSGFEVCRIDGSVKLEERRKQVTAATAFISLSLMLPSFLHNKVIKSLDLETVLHSKDMVLLAYSWYIYLFGKILV